MRVFIGLGGFDFPSGARSGIFGRPRAFSGISGRSWSFEGAAHAASRPESPSVMGHRCQSASAEGRRPLIYRAALRVCDDNRAAPLRPSAIDVAQARFHAQNVCFFSLPALRIQRDPQTTPR